MINHFGKKVLSIFLIVTLAMFIIVVNKGKTVFSFSRDLSHFELYKDSPQILSYTINNSIKKRNYLLQPPMDFNEDVLYPLVISLHGYTKSKNAYFTPIIANDRDQQQQYPCFFLAPNNTVHGWGENAKWVRELVSQLIQQYPIDQNRIYIIGFSMGGSGSFLFAEGLRNEHMIITSAIIRCAGMSQAELIPELSDKTAVWYNVGTTDSDKITEVAKAFFNYCSKMFQKDRNSPTIKITEQFPRNTYSFHNNEKDDFAVFSTFEGMGHDYIPVFENEDVIEWLFRQSL